ncbi:MAG TPA: AMIN domain-containing protein [Deltaproteobacteria bacterium]|nr:AMIN domain-containing protein [Deltaproteobacteria bacterium]HIJ39586.1 AMIN domain-containing protein [Deltaproteobacteria bacterium]
MGIKAYHFLFLILAALLFGGVYDGVCSAKEGTKVLLEKSDLCKKNLLNSSKKKQYRHNWIACIRNYQVVYKSYPKSEEAPWALFNAAKLYTFLYKYSGKSTDIDEAVTLYRQLADQYKSHRLADDAQYRIGEIYYTSLDDPTQAYVEFLKVDVNFPEGDMRPRAKKKIDALSVKLRSADNKTVERAKGGTKKVAIKDIRYWSTPNYTRVVVDAGGPVKYEHHLLKADPDHEKPRRLYIDLENARVAKNIDTDLAIKNELLQRARAGQFTKKTVRVVLDIEKIGGYDIFHLFDPFRIVVDVRRFPKEPPKTSNEPVVNAGEEPVAKKRMVQRGVKKAGPPDENISLARQLGLNVKRIVIDPGHGGRDPGCYVPGGLQEKIITLSIAKLLAEKMREKLGCEVFLTRDRDKFMSLENRTAIANMKKADLFISLHVNAHKSRNIKGLETYFLNMATDKGAVMVAARENATSEKNISDLQTILNDLMLNTKIYESSRLAHKVQSGMYSAIEKGHGGTRNLGVKQAPFYVLIGAEMPAILVEVGFLSNSTEKKRLMSRKYQQEIARGICDGIDAYIESIELVYHAR